MNQRFIEEWQLTFELVYCLIPLFILSSNLGQRIGDKFTTLSKIDFSMKRITDDISQFFLPRYVKFWLFGGRLGTRRQTQAFQGFS